MNLLFTPLFLLGLLTGPVEAVECVGERDAAGVCENYGIKSGARAADGVSERLDRQARKHTEFYQTLVRAQQNAGSRPGDARQYSARADSSQITKFQAP